MSGTETERRYARSGLAEVECEESNLHVRTEYGVTELIGKDGDEVRREGEVGELVGTSFHNYAMPFIRYKTGDVASKAGTACSCGRSLPLLQEVDGRTQEFVVTRDGRVISFNVFLFSLDFKEANSIRQFQFLQEEAGRLRMKAVLAPGAKFEDVVRLCRRLEEKVHGDVEVEPMLTDRIPGTGTGKYQYMVQKLPAEELFFRARQRES